MEPLAKEENKNVVEHKVQQAQQKNAEDSVGAANLLDLARRFKVLKDSAKAIDSYEQSVCLDVNNFKASLELANLLTELGYGRHASIYYQNALRLKPESAAAIFGLVLAIERHAKDP